METLSCQLNSTSRIASMTEARNVSSTSPVNRWLASVILVNFHLKHRLAVALPSVFAAHGNYEVIVADNGSQDGSLEFLENTYPQVRVVRNGTNLGFAAGNNRGRAVAQGEILVFLNPDTKVEPDWLEHLIAPFDDPSVGLVTAKIRLLQEPHRLNTCGNDIHLSGLTLCRGVGQPAEQFDQPEEVGAVSGAAFAIRREVFDAVGGFDEDFFMYMEETNLSCHARLAGWRCLYAPRSVVYHDYELRFGPHKVFLQERNRYIMLLRLYRWPTLLILLPSLFLAEVVSWGFVLTRDRHNWKNKFRAYAWVLTHWSIVMVKRRECQAVRKLSDRQLLIHHSYRLDFGQVSQGLPGRLANWIFNPLFGILWLITRGLVWW